MINRNTHTDYRRKINKFRSILLKIIALICIPFVSYNYYYAIDNYYDANYFPYILKYYTEINMLIVLFFIIIYFFIMKKVKEYYIQNQ